MAKRARKKKGPGGISITSQLRSKERASSIPWTTALLFLLKITVITLTTLWIFWPTLHGDWLWDDDTVILKNALIHDPDGLRKIWLEPASLIDYFPLTVSAEWLQWQFWHEDTFGYHLTNILLHILNALLIWRLLSKLGLKLAWLGGLLFAVHPVMVESVAWMVELKNTLSLLPFLLAMCSWVDYENEGKRRDYFLALGLFLVAILAKTGVVMFPFVILLYAWWKRDRIAWHDAKASLPFFIVSLAMGLITIWFLHHHAIDSRGMETLGFFSRVALAGLSMAFYLSKALLPVGLMPIYPRWVINPPSWMQFLPWLLLVGTIYGFWMKRTGWGRHALLGLGFFVVMLFPFMGVVQGSYMGFTWVMDHLLYIPLIGLIGLAVAGLEKIRESLSVPLRFAGAGMVAIMIGLLAWGSHAYAEIYKNEEALWTYELRYNPEAWIAHNNLATALFIKGQYAEAVEQYEQVIQTRPNYFEIQLNLGMALFHANRFDEAIEHYQQALKINPDAAEAHFNLGVSWDQKKQASDAIHEFEETLRLDPNHIAARHNLGLILLQTNHVPEAIAHYEQVVKLIPNETIGHYDLGNALLRANRLPEAMEQFNAVSRLNPDDADAYKDRGYTLIQMGRAREAIKQFEIYLKLNPNDEAIRNQLSQLQISGNSQSQPKSGP